MKIKLAFVLLFTFVMTGCNRIKTTFTEPNITGYVMDKDEESVLVVSDQAEDFSSTGGMEDFYDAVIASNPSDEVEIGDFVEVWFDGGMDASYPGQAAISSLNIIASEQSEGANLTESEALRVALSEFPSKERVLTVISISYDKSEDIWSVVLLESQSDNNSYQYIFSDE